MKQLKKEQSAFTHIALAIASLFAACGPQQPPDCNARQYYSPITRGCVGLGDYMSQHDGALPDGFDAAAAPDVASADTTLDQQGESRTDVGTCGDTRSDSQHCGACNRRCAVPNGGTARCVDGNCIAECSSGSHLCGDTCASNDAPATCGDRCSPCSAPSGGAATCNAGSCGVSCPERTHLCGNACLSDDSIDSCGSNCWPCALPSMPRCSPPLVDFVSVACIEGGLTSLDNTCLVGVYCGMPIDAGRD
jgi:hypothetical protein